MTTFEVIDLDDPRFAVCGARSPSGRIGCEYPPDHRIGEAGTAQHHCGRDRLGRWRSWAMKDTRENQILALRQQGATHDAIAAEVGISRERVCQILAEVWKRNA